MVHGSLKKGVVVFVLFGNNTEVNMKTHHFASSICLGFLYLQKNSILQSNDGRKPNKIFFSFPQKRITALALAFKCRLQHAFLYNTVHVF